MQLIHTLNEASAIPIDDLKKVMTKDARIKQIFGTHLDVDSIVNRTEFLTTLKFFLLNNRNVIDFVDGRDYIRKLDKTTLKRLRELKPREMTQKDIDSLQTFVSDLFREHSFVEKSGMSPSARKEVLDWVNANGRYFDLSRATQKELQSLPNIHPTRPVMVYRGLLFNASDLRERKRYDGQLEVGKGLKFLRSIRDGARIVDLDWDRASSWSTSKEVAMRFAKFSSAQSNFEATMNWLQNSASGKKIHGELGFIISTLAKPEDVLIDVSRMVTTAHMKHGDEGEFILKPGSYTCRVNTKYTKADGEVDPQASSQVDDSVSSAIEAVKEFSNRWMKDDASWKQLTSDDWHGIDVERELRQGNIENFGILARASTKTKALADYEELLKFYHEHIDSLSEGQLETLAANPKLGKIIRWIGDTRKSFNETKRHKDHKSTENYRGEVKKKNLTAAQARETAYGSMATQFDEATKGGRFTGYGVGSTVSTLLKGLTGATASDVHRLKGAEQQKHIDTILAAFYEKFGMDQPPDRTEAIRKMRSALLGAERNAALLNSLISIRGDLDTALGSESSAE